MTGVSSLARGPSPPSGDHGRANLNCFRVCPSSVGRTARRRSWITSFTCTLTRSGGATGLPTSPRTWWRKLLAGATRKDGRDGPLSDGSKAEMLNVIAQVLDYALEERAIPSNPARQIRKDRKPKQGTISARTYSPEEQKRLLAYCGRFPWLRPIIAVAVLQALRLGEVLALRPKDVDYADGRLTVLRQLLDDGTYGPTKGWQPTDDPEFHVIDLNPEAAKILRDLTPDSAEKPYFRNTLGQQRSKADVRRAFRKARKYAGLSAEPGFPASTISGTLQSPGWRTLLALRSRGFSTSHVTRRSKPPTATCMRSAMSSACRPRGRH